MIDNMQTRAKKFDILACELNLSEEAIVEESPILSLRMRNNG